MAGYNGESITINDQTQSFGTTEEDGIFLTRFNNQEQLEIINRIVGENAMSILDVAYSEDKSRITIALEGTGSLLLNENLIYNNDTESRVILLTFENNSGQLLWQKEIHSPNLNSNKFDIVYGNSHDLFVGTTFSGMVSIDTVVIAGIGKEDIGLFKISSTAEILWGREHGSMEDENVSQLFYNNGILFLGGEMGGALSERKIGFYKFVNITGSLERSYISYIKDENSIQSANSDSGKNKNLNQGIEENLVNASGFSKQLIEVYPNPFNNNFVVKILDPEIFKIQIYNTNGQIILSETVEERSVMEIDFQNIAPGVFYVKGMDQEGNVKSQIKTVKTN